MSTIEKVKFRCLCGTRITASIGLAGKTGRCPNCKATVVIPDPKAKTLAGDVKIFDLVEKPVEDIGSDDLANEVLGSKTPPKGPGTSGVHVVNIPKSSAGRYAFIGVLLRWKKNPVPYTIAFVILSAVIVLAILAAWEHFPPRRMLNRPRKSLKTTRLPNRPRNRRRTFASGKSKNSLRTPYRSVQLPFLRPTRKNTSKSRLTLRMSARKRFSGKSPAALTRKG